MIFGFSGCAFVEKRLSHSETYDAIEEAYAVVDLILAILDTRIAEDQFSEAVTYYETARDIILFALTKIEPFLVTPEDMEQYQDTLAKVAAMDELLIGE